MQVYPNRLNQHIEKGLAAFYLIFGDEPQQKMQSIETVRQYAKSVGFDERQTLTADAQFNWNSLLEATQTLSLFSAKQFIELELPTGKPGTEGSKILTELAVNPNPDTLILLHGAKIGKDVQNAKWFKALDKHGVYIPCYPLEGNQLTQWINQYLRECNLFVEPDAAKLLTDFCEGNLLAAKQEIDKLALLFPNGKLTFPMLEQSVVDQSRFNVFQLVDVMLAGDAQKTVKMLYRLEAEGVEPTIILWALAREWQTLSTLKFAQQKGHPINWNQHRIWKNRQQFYLQALQRLDELGLNAIQQKLQIMDQRIKQSSVVRPYVELCHICLLFMPFSLTGLPLEA